LNPTLAGFGLVGLQSLCRIAKYAAACSLSSMDKTTTPEERLAALDAMAAHRDARDINAATSVAYKEHDQRYQRALLIYLNLGR
jgi:hypothetical protein